MSELKPCPHCGGTNLEIKIGTILGHNPVSAVYCMTCGGAGAHAEIEEHAREAWNRRAPLPPAEPGVDWERVATEATVTIGGLERERDRLRAALMLHEREHAKQFKPLDCQCSYCKQARAALAEGGKA